MSEFEWIEALPAKCPPATAISPAGRVFYRFVEKAPPEDTDFQPTRLRVPPKAFSLEECQSHAISVFSDLQAAKDRTTLAGNKKYTAIVAITLPTESGLIIQTGRDKHHWSWWRAKGFDLLSQFKNKDQ